MDEVAFKHGWPNLFAGWQAPKCVVVNDGVEIQLRLCRFEDLMGEVRIKRSVMYMSTAATPQDSNDFTQPVLEFDRREHADSLDQRLGENASKRCNFFDS
ncbi:hypothetical protein RS3R6_27720 [Pseudomonas atacamensis]|uniref:Uncharacterized protein n=1 Tax=Pseudomonas atacamensis TaxID=2565368 RepID=A0ABQ5PSV1_9PSED|nr:hypothetical protein RS3R1_53540 [Pseudomonas atacamensis]GLH54590.1 hypothetical protein RS3R6_27720 [Pseudomonas atacamensis]